MRLLAEEFVKAGHEVKVVSGLPIAPSTTTYQIFPRPPFSQFLRLLRWCDVICQSSISLKQMWPFLFVRRPIIVIHHTWYQACDGRRRIRDRLKLKLCGFVTNVAVSRAMAEHLGGGAEVIPNPFDDEIFRTISGIPRNRQLVFVGRLVLDKGGETLLRAVAMLRNMPGNGDTAEKPQPLLTIVGDGPERRNLETLAAELDISAAVKFSGEKDPSELARILNEHELLVVPSLWKEPFGVSALEGIACGCVVVGSSGGGLPEAIGACGETFPNGDAKALASTLHDLLSEPHRLTGYRGAAADHLNVHRKANVAAQYLSLFARCTA